MSRLLMWGTCLVAVLVPAAGAAQSAREGRVQVTVVDETGGVIPEALVSIVGLEPATQALTLAPVRTTDKGVAVVERVTPGRYSIRAEFTTDGRLQVARGQMLASNGYVQDTDDPSSRIELDRAELPAPVLGPLERCCELTARHDPSLVDCVWARA